MQLILNFILILLVINPGELLASTNDISDKSWKAFRKSYPYSFQGIAVEKLAEQQYVIIAAEPPPHVTPEDLKALLPTVSLKKHTVGYMGWALDAVDYLKLTESEYIELIQDIHKLYYDTVYKAFVIDIPSLSQKTKQTHQLDYEFFPGELESWITSGSSGKDLLFESLTTAELKTIEDIDLEYADVFHSSPYGLVGLWIPNNNSLECCNAQIRQFAVDSDLIIGATKNNNGIILLARVRQVPFEILPPLRAETIQQLSQVRGDELHQTINSVPLSSYVNVENNDVERWELNILSSELVDIELGALLTLSDVLLKSWSMNGFNSVRGYRDYPTPKTWPFKEFLPKHLGVSNIVFNYDSGAAGYTTKTKDGHALYGLSRTGVLPLAYLPDELIVNGQMPPSVQKAEVDGFDWFARQQDPNLVRVVQYTAILQAFRACGLSAKAEDNGSMYEGPLMTNFRNIIVSLIKEISKYDDQQIQSLAEKLANSVHEKKKIEEVIKLFGMFFGREGNVDEDLDHMYKIYVSEAKSTYVTDIESIRYRAKDSESIWAERLTNPNFLTDMEMKAITKFLEVDRTEDEVSEFENKIFTKEVQREIKLISGLTGTFQSLSSVLRLDETLALKQSDEGKYSWLHTPVLVYDLNKGLAADWSGGHNLKIGTESLIPSSKVAKGAITRNRDGSWAVHPKDYPKVKFLGRGREPVLAKSAPEAVSMASKLSLDKAFEYWKPTFWKGNTRAVLTNQEKALIGDINTTQPGALAVIRRNDGTFVIYNGKIATVKNTHRELIDGVQDLAGGRPTYDVVTAGFNPGEVKGLVSSLASRRGPPGKIGKFSNGRGGEKANLIKLVDDQFSPKSLDANSAKIVKFESNSSSLYGEVTFLAKGVQSGTIKLNFWAYVNNKIVTAKYWSKEKISSWLKSSVQESNTVLDLKNGVTKRMRDDLEKTFPGHNFDDVNFKVYMPDLLKYYYITEINDDPENARRQSS